MIDRCKTLHQCTGESSLSGARAYTDGVRPTVNTPAVPSRTTKRPFARELPGLLAARRLTLRGLAREVGGLDHAYLSRMISGSAPVNVDHVRRISQHLGLADDYFPEIREAEVVKAIRADPELRDEVYAKLTRRRRA